MKLSILFIVVASLVATSAYAQTNIEGDITTNTTWTLSGSPYIVTGWVTVENGVTLTIEPGVLVKFSPFDTLYGYSCLRVYGYLVALGTETDSIIFTSNSVSPSPFSWLGISFEGTHVILDGEGNYVSGTVLNHCRVEYAADGVMIDYGSSVLIESCALEYNYWRGIYLGGSDTGFVRNTRIAYNEVGAAVYGACVIDSCIVEHNSSRGINVGNSDNVTIRDNRIANNKYGVYLAGCCSNSTIIDSCIVEHNSYAGIYVSNSDSVTIRDNRIANNKYGVYLVGCCPRLESNTFLNNDLYNIAVGAGTISSSGTWYNDNGQPYVVLGDVNVQGSAGSPATLTLSPGLTLTFASGAGLRVGNAAPGALYAVGTPDSLITFTSLSGATNGWDGICFHDYSDRDGAVSSMSYCLVEKAGQTGWGVSANIYCRSTAQPTMINCIIRNSGGSGVYLSNSNSTIIGCELSANGLYGLAVMNSSPVVRSSRIISNDSCGVFCDGNNSHPVIGDTLGLTCVLSGNGTFDLFNNTNNIIQARHNMWSRCDSMGIEERIFHCQDNPSKGCVLFSPWGGQEGALEHDVRALYIISPTDSVNLGSIVTPQAVVKNFGNNTETFPVIFQIASFYTDTVIVNSLAPGDTQVVTFAEWVAQPSGTYLPFCFPDLEVDVFRVCDTAHGYFMVPEAGIGPEIYSISPNRGGNTGGITATIVGNRFREGAIVKLAKEGEPDIIADTAWTWVTDSTKITAGFNLKDKPLGWWNVVVINPDSSSATLHEGFTIETGYQNLWVNITGRDWVRIDRPTDYIISYGNEGNVDAYCVLLKVSGIPANATITLASPLAYPPQREGWDPIDWSIVPFYYEDGEDGVLVMPLFLPIIPANSNSYIRIRISVPSVLDYYLRASIGPPWVEIPSSSGVLFGKILSNSEEEDGVECAEAIINTVNTALYGYGGGGCFDAVVGTGLGIASFVKDYSETNEFDQVSTIQLITDGALAVAKCAGQLNPVSKLLLTAWTTIEVIDGLVDVYNECVKPLREDEDDKNEKEIRVRTSSDPNDKVGPGGFSDSGYVVGNEVFNYMIFFENVDTAAFEAENIWITDTLDEDLDWTALQLGEIFPGAGPESIRPNYNAVTNFDPINGVITWSLLNINLPPDTMPYWGEGWVSYSIKPKADLATGTRIENIAAIKFDQNDWILAPMDSIPIVNTIDAGPPSSNVASLPDTTFDTHFTVTWSGTDDLGGSGIRSYSVYCSDNGGLFVPWLVDTTATSAEFMGEFNHTYAFYSIARDNVGHIEETPSSPDAQTATAIGYGSLSGFVTADSAGGLLGVNLDIDSVGTLWKSVVTDNSGHYHIDSIPSGRYSVTVMTPLGYRADQETKEFTITRNPITINFDLTKLDITSQQRSVGYWKHQVNVYLSGQGTAQESLADMSKYMNRIRTHFNSNPMNPITIFQVSQPAAQTDSLEALQSLLTVNQGGTMNDRAKQHLIALMLNVVSLKLHQTTIISLDSATVSQAITYCNQLITDSEPANDELAKDIADKINNSIMVASGKIPLTTPNIMYKVEDDEIVETPNLPEKFSLSQSYPNPFNPMCQIRYALPINCHVTLNIYNVLGQRVRVLVDEYQSAGHKSVKWDGKDEQGREVSSGVYFYRIQAGDFVQSKKMVLLK